MKKSIKYYLIYIILVPILSVIYAITILYIDFEILSPLLLPEDKCYYHTHKTPFWVDFLYMSAHSGGHPEGSLTHILFVIIIGFVLGYITSKKLIKYFTK